MGPVEALKLVLAREVQSIELYEKLMRQFPVAKETFFSSWDKKRNISN